MVYMKKSYSDKTELASFSYVAIDPKRNLRVRGTWFAATEDKARIWLESQGYNEIKLRRRQDSLKTVQVSSSALALFYRQLATLLQSSVPLAFALQLVSASEDASMVGVGRMLEAKVTSGEYLSKAMDSFPKVFNRIDVNLIRAGEASGSLQSVLLDIADAKERQLELRNRIVAALTYPLMLTLVLAIVGAIFIFFVIPGDVELFSGLGVELPVINRMLIYFVQAIGGPWLWVVTLVSLMGVVALVQSEKVRLKAKELVAQALMVFQPTRELLLKARATHLIRILYLIVSNGGTIALSLKLMRESSSLPYEQEQLDYLSSSLTDGGDFALALERTGIFPAIAVALLQVGFETAKLCEMSGKALEICEEDVKIGVDTLSAMLEPIIMGVMGVFAGLIIIIGAMPMIKLIEAI